MAGSFIKFIKWFIGVTVVIALLVYLLGWNMKRNAKAMLTQSTINGPYDVIIVPGLPYEPDKTNTLFKVRMLWAKALYDKGVARNIIFSGGAVHTCWQEGTVMKTMADSMGINPANTFAELRAEHSNQNVYYGYKMATQLGFKKVAVATDQFQDFFLSSYINKRLPQVARLPLPVDSFPVYSNMQLPHIDATCARVDSFIPLNKRKSRIERLRTSWGDEVKE